MSQLHNISFGTLDGRNIRVGIVTARWNSELTHALRDGIVDGLTDCAVPSNNIVHIDVAGAFELLAGARYLIDRGEVDVIVCVGVLINGSTDHYHYIASAVSTGIAELNIIQSVPVLFGVLTCQTEEQARERSIGPANHGVAWGKTAVEMALLRK
jgi:6,7-dimethyl-8-ribityllumazine synthase